jgi:hypothetical protein
MNRADKMSDLAALGKLALQAPITGLPVSSRHGLRIPSAVDLPGTAAFIDVASPPSSA